MQTLRGEIGVNAGCLFGFKQLKELNSCSFKANSHDAKVDGILQLDFPDSNRLHTQNNVKVLEFASPVDTERSTHLFSLRKNNQYQCLEVFPTSWDVSLLF